MSLSGRVRPGQEVSRSADVENAMRAAAEAYAMQSGGSAMDRGLVGRSTGIIRIKNTSEDNLGRYAVLGIDSSLFDPETDETSFKSSITLTGVTPAAGTHEGKWAVLLQPIEAGKLGSAIISGPVQVQITGPEGKAFAEIDDGKTTLLAGDSGSARILYDPGIADGETADDPRFAIVRIGEGGESSNSGAVLILTDIRISTTFFGKANLLVVAEGGGALSAGAAIYTQQTLHYPGPDSTYLLSPGNIVLGNFIGVGDPGSLGEELPVYAVIPRVATAGLTVIGKSSGAGNDVTYEDVDTLTFTLPELVSGGNGSVDVGLQNINLNFLCNDPANSSANFSD